MGTNIDPSLCRADGLVGQILGERGTLPPVYTEITIKYNLFRHLIGLSKDDSQKQPKVCHIEFQLSNYITFHLF